MEAIPARRALSKVDFLIFVPLPPDDQSAARRLQLRVPLRVSCLYELWFSAFLIGTRLQPGSCPLSKRPQTLPCATTIRSFDITNLNLISSITVDNLTGTVQSLVRWGTNGLAFNTNQGEIVLLGGSFVN